VVTLTVTMGVPGSGKTTWCEAQPGWLAGTDPARVNGQPWRDLHASLLQSTRRQLEAGVNVVTDGCNVHTQLRRSWLEVGRDVGAWCVLAILECDDDEALRRNAGRPVGQRVPPNKMTSYLRRFPAARMQAGGEGWDAITYPMPRSVVGGATRAW
jgi:predicted kinase